MVDFLDEVKERSEFSRFIRLNLNSQYSIVGSISAFVGHIVLLIKMQIQFSVYIETCRVLLSLSTYACDQAIVQV